MKTLTAHAPGKTATRASAPKPEPKGWSQHLDRARSRWPELDDEELLASGGRADVLADLVQKRYAIRHVSAQQQVETFLGETVRYRARAPT